MIPAWLDQTLTTLAFLWRLDRQDGVTIGFTSHDRDLIRSGLRYRAAPGMLPSAIERSDGFDVDSVELSGAVTSDALRADDLLEGRWDGSALTVSVVDWQDASVVPLIIVRGELGAVEVSGESFRTEVRGAAARLDIPVVEETSPACRATLGDKRCRVDLARLRSVTKVIAATLTDVTIAGTATSGDYAFGSLRWLDGAFGGLTSAIADNAGPLLILREALPHIPPPGTLVEVIEGCDRRFATCTGRFANAINFRGEPHVPGNDLLTRYAS